MSKPTKIVLAAVLSLQGVLGAEEISSEGRHFFEEKVRPILEESCLRCHSEAEKKRKGGLLLDRRAGWLEGGDSGESVLNLENPGESLLIKMVHHDPDYEAMPPKKKLSEQEITDLLAWVEMGAPDPRSEAIGDSLEKEVFDLEERKKWWSLQPLAQVEVPGVDDSSWARTDVDRFLLAKLEEKGWVPAEPVEKSRLLRRASFALTGLAPTVAELEGFLSDDRPDAYERQVDRLLASPHFGERFARHWMDVVRYADSKAFEQDYTIPFAHQYRDYLIRAFNQDVPFDQFVKEAFAGDLLEEPRIDKGVNESVIGPGFLLSTDGQHGPPDLHVDEARIFDDMINTASVAFQGLTVACARCHDHKFDAITAADYYSMYGMLRSSRLNYANISSFDESHRKIIAGLEQSKKDLVERVLSEANVETRVIEEALELLGNPEVQGLLSGVPSQRKPEQITKLRSFAKELLVANWLEFLAMEQSIPELNGLRRALSGKGPQSKMGTSDNLTRHQWRIEGEGFEKVEGGEWVMDASEPRLFRAGASNGYVAGALSARIDGKLRSEDFVLDGSPVVLWARGRGATVNLIVRNYELVGYGPTTNGLRIPLSSDSFSRIQFKTDLWVGETAYLEVLHQGEVMKCVRPTEEVGQADDHAYVHVPASFDPQSWNELWADVTPASVAERLNGLLKSPDRSPEVIGALMAHGLVKIHPDQAILNRFKEEGRALPKPQYVRSLTDGQVYDEPVYIRGSHQSPSKEANPKHFLDGFSGARIGEAGSGRLEFAEHLVTTSKALTARVRVNRIWSRIFGQGIVGSVDDFGKMGELPSHPELLDFLSQRFIEEDWSTKRLVRDLMISSAYRMSTIPGDGVAEVDPKNALLQHMPIQRLDAESIRDHILLVSGNLKRDLFGPTVRGYVKDLPRSRAFPTQGSVDGEGRRTIYLEIRRNFLSSFLRAFNLPMPSAPVGQRQVTTVPAQSLTLMNSEFAHQQAKVWAASLQGSEDEKIRQIHLQAFSRPPGDGEIAWSKDALSKLGESPWVSLCHLMINRKEFLYVF
ncbi:PSD1 and planctomycete cytochrome C domain-containing protein [Verrucomicrobiaceae bacterium 227]